MHECQSMAAIMLIQSIVSPILRLIRFDKPIGTLLLWCPTAWALWLSNHGSPPLRLVLIFFLGTFFMRSAGCVLNDIADRNIDRHVARTQHRPLTSGEIRLQQAFVALFLLLICAFIILLQLPTACFNYALGALGLTTIYPFCKRFISAPQTILGFAFSMGIPMAYAASDVPLNTTTFLLILINLMWVIAYDTLYAMVDKADDLKIGVKSTAILFGQWTHLIIKGLQLGIQILWIMIGLLNQLSYLFYIAWTLGCLVFIAQQSLMAKQETPDYFKAFLINGLYGLLLWGGLI